MVLKLLGCDFGIKLIFFNLFLLLMIEKLNQSLLERIVICGAIVTVVIIIVTGVCIILFLLEPQGVMGLAYVGW